jgi:hypothetical protein
MVENEFPLLRSLARAARRVGLDAARSTSAGALNNATATKHG